MPIRTYRLGGYKEPIKVRAYDYVLKNPNCTATEIAHAINEDPASVSSALVKMVNEDKLMRYDGRELKKNPRKHKCWVYRKYRKQKAEIIGSLDDDVALPLSQWERLLQDD
jgi:hypothetical protein